MKKYFYFLFFASAFIACKKEIEQPVDYVIISGKIKNTTSSEIKLYWTDFLNVNPIKETTIKVSKEGVFLDTLRVMSGQYAFSEGDNNIPLHIVNGDNINASYNADNFKNTLIVKGKGSEIIKYLQVKDEVIKSTMNMEFYNHTEEEFIKNLNELKSKLDSVLTNVKNISPKVSAREKSEIQYLYLDYISRFAGMGNESEEETKPALSSDLTKELDALDLNNEADFMFSSTYQGLLLEYYMKEASKISEKNGTEYTLEAVKLYAKVPNKNIRDFLLFNEGAGFLPRTNSLDEMYKLLDNNLTNKEKKNHISVIYKDLKKLEKGQPSPTFTKYENYAGDTSSLSDFKGKYVFIDVWATWCGPCTYEIPFIEKLEKKYHNKNIVFVSISVDVKKDYEAWRKIIKEENMKGIQLLADNDFDSGFIKEYKINGIPKFILLDPEGKIVTANAPYPSSKKIEELLNKLL